MGNTNMNKARARKNDEFYTLYKDIENEVKYYKDKFEGKVIYLNCDNPKLNDVTVDSVNDNGSNFWNFFIFILIKIIIITIISCYYFL